MCRHEKIFSELQDFALTIEPSTRSRHAAALVHKTTVLAIGGSRKITHPFQKRFATNEQAIWIHAELDAINKALKRYDADLIERSSLYVLRVKYADSKKNTVVRAMSKPCENGCQQAIAAFGIKRVIYTTDEGFERL